MYKLILLLILFIPITSSAQDKKPNLPKPQLQELETMIDRLGDTNVYVRKHSAFSIMEKYGERAIPQLIESLSNENWIIRFNILGVLSQMPEEMNQYVSNIQELFESEKNVCVRFYAGKLLFNLGHKEKNLLDQMVRLSLIILGTPPTSSNVLSTDYSWIHFVWTTLHQIDATQANGYLQNLNGQEAFKRLYSLQIVSCLQPGEAEGIVPDIKTLLKNETNIYIRFWALKTLAHLSPENYVDAFCSASISMLKDYTNSEQTRQTVFFGVEFEHLKGLLTDSLLQINDIQMYILKAYLDKNASSDTKQTAEQLLRWLFKYERLNLLSPATFNAPCMRVMLKIMVSTEKSFDYNDHGLCQMPMKAQNFIIDELIGYLSKSSDQTVKQQSINALTHLGLTKDAIDKLILKNKNK